MFAWHPFSGCSPASSGCANCVAATPGGLHDGLTAGQHFNGKLRFNDSELFRYVDMSAGLIFVCPNGDVFHEAAPDEWLERVFTVIDFTARHRYVILTKRAARMHDWLRGRYPNGVPENVAVGVSVEDQAAADLRVPALLALPGEINRYISVYPMIGPVNLSRFLSRLNQVNAGEEAARPARAEWFEALERDCADAGVPFTRGALLPFYGTVNE